jgi:ABC-2 type transport system permease protein
VSVEPAPVGWRADARKVRAIAGGSLRRLFRDRTNIFFILVFPLLLVLVVGVVFGGFDKVGLGVVAPPGDELAGRVVAALRHDDQLDVHRYPTESRLRSAVEHHEVEGGVVVPPGFATRLRAGDDASIGFLAGPTGAGLALQPVVDAAVRPELVDLQAARFAADHGDGDGDFDAALARATELGGQLPAVTVRAHTVGDRLFSPKLGRFDVSAAQQLLLFMFVTGLASSVAIIRSRRLGVTRRMLSTPTSVTVVLGGEMLGRFTVVALQGVYIVSATWLLFGVSWGDPIGALALVVVFALVATGAAMLAGALFSNEQQSSSAGVMIGLGLGAIGGCMVPLQIFPSTLRTIAHLTPHAWALDAFDELVGNDAGVGAILPNLAVVAAMAVVLLALATWRLRRVITR